MVVRQAHPPPTSKHTGLFFTITEHICPALFDMKANGHVQGECILKDLKTSKNINTVQDRNQSQKKASSLGYHPLENKYGIIESETASSLKLKG